MSAGSAFRIDPTIHPDGPLRPTQVFLELGGFVGIQPAVRAAMDREVGHLLRHLPPNAWSPLMIASHRELQVVARWPGTVELELPDGPRTLPIDWRPQWIERDGVSERAVLRGAIVLDLPTRAAASAAASALVPRAACGSRWHPHRARVALPAAPEWRFEARLERAADALDLVCLDDEAGETRGLMRQRHDYGGIPTIIELWSMGEYAARCWIMLEADVADRFGSVDLSAVEALVQPDVVPGRRAEAHARGGVVVVNEAGEA